MNFIQWAGAFLAEGVACTDGHDAGPIVDDFLAYVNLPPGNAWCAATASYCAHKALFDAGVEEPANPWFKTASSQEMMRMAKANGTYFEDPNHLLKCKGAIMGYTDLDKVHGHIMPISNRYTDVHGHVVSVRTIEGNSDTKPNNAMASIIRSTTVATKGRKIWFIDIGGVHGCDYW